MELAQEGVVLDLRSTWMMGRRGLYHGTAFTVMQHLKTGILAS